MDAGDAQRWREVAQLRNTLPDGGLAAQRERLLTMDLL
jgi:hypothetical protein